ncbi:hypothetical protein DL96DRAFT_1469838 [Flagelloscypha sp. PMI_526]|nr:hypothetical protein DL96DRAFT_1469838 [Flagelloscypha sp. PMI_526]
MAAPSTIPPVIDWAQTPLPEYKDHYAKVIDGLFSSEECAELLALATSEPPKTDPASPLAQLQEHHATKPNPQTGKVEWQQAAVHYGLGASSNYVDTDYRNSDRILRFDVDAANKIYEKLRPLLPELWEIRQTEENGEAGKWSKIVSRTRDTSNTVWKLVGVNERLSYLRYKPGHYFRAHCDGNQDLPDGRKARVTIQIYLNGPPHDSEDPNASTLRGGSTRFLSPSNPDRRYYDIEPKMGRVLVFQHRGLWHSGHDLEAGEKYALRTDLFFTTEEE